MAVLASCECAQHIKWLYCIASSLLSTFESMIHIMYHIRIHLVPYCCLILSFQHVYRYIFRHVRFTHTTFVCLAKTSKYYMLYRLECDILRVTFLKNFAVAY